jgi:hypothetical protein
MRRVLALPACLQAFSLAGLLAALSFACALAALLVGRRCRSSSRCLGDSLSCLPAFAPPQINRYGPWMDVNLVLPLGQGRCRWAVLQLAAGAACMCGWIGLAAQGLQLAKCSERH